jgi:hypothetical protein
MRLGMFREGEQTREGGRDKGEGGLEEGEGKRDFHGLSVGGASLEARIERIWTPAIHPSLKKSWMLVRMKNVSENKNKKFTGQKQHTKYKQGLVRGVRR